MASKLKNTKPWNQDLTDSNTVKEKVYIDTEDRHGKYPCCFKLRTDRINKFIKLHQEFYPPSVENEWEHQANTITIKARVSR